MKISTVYFSATHTTKRVIEQIASAMSDHVQHHNITTISLSEEVVLAPDELLLVGMPVYAGRIPCVAVNALKSLKGTHTPVILVAVYGNRDFDDVFVEMQDLLEPNGFFVLGAGAFVAQHSIFPHTGKGRPDAEDLIKIQDFAHRCKDLFEKGFSEKAQSIALPGNRPYKIPGKIPLKLTVDANCTECGACIRACPVQAIPIGQPHITDNDKCIHCGRCTYICPTHARHYSGLLYHLAGTIFKWKNHERKEPQFFFSQSE